ncbi:MAG: protein kinase [Myxococcota bacterium]
MTVGHAQTDQSTAQQSAQQSAQPSPQMVARVGNLVLRRWLAQGGMAELYLATPADPAQSSDVVVLKRVLPQFSSSSNFVRMFAREARLASMLQHPNIVEVRDAGGLGAEDCFFTMEYVHGIDLGQFLDALRVRGGTMPLAHALTIAVAMCAGLHHAHEAHNASSEPLGIVHRDVSPSNVLLGFEGSIKVTDFGVAKALAMTRLTEEGTRKGKLCYMSPEQATGETVDRRADVFAIATVLYELTTMERLFGGDNDLAVMHNLIHRPRPRPRDVSPGYPAALEAIVMKGVASDINDRYPTALSLQQALEGFADEVGLTLSSEAVGAFVRQTVPAPVHPRDDPEFLSKVIALRTPPQMVTEVQAEHAAVTDGSVPHVDPRAIAPTGPHVSALPVSGAQGATEISMGPGMSAPSASLPPALVSGRNPLPSAAWPPVAPQPPALHRWSLVLAVLALLAAGTAGYTVWRADQREPTAPAESAPAVPAAPSTPAESAVVSTKPDPAPESEPEPEPEPKPEPEPEPKAKVPADPATSSGPGAAGRRKGKRRSKKRAQPEPEPPPPPIPAPEEPAPPSTSTSKKTSPTDTLLPIRE